MRSTTWGVWIIALGWILLAWTSLDSPASATGPFVRTTGTIAYHPCGAGVIRIFTTHKAEIYNPTAAQLGKRLEVTGEPYHCGGPFTGPLAQPCYSTSFILQASSKSVRCTTTYEELCRVVKGLRAHTVGGVQGLAMPSHVSNCRVPDCEDDYSPPDI